MADEIRETHLLEIEWSPSRTGLINPVAVFEPVELEGNHCEPRQRTQCEHSERIAAWYRRYDHCI